ncbi:hypothetical protein ACPOL_4143 [Acidisarcina polymorpha]|uniref:Uncharacterized protein n=1 Tax=Acidisarcina polymorpha TaxID=2211140 RepID=A0A2Z5G316_9BACT|nr:hypothetical protein [Acidisarcina polymorpha]AXC13420.1 hypothetical protein ACPOL_4143 [Acidisarcina polymorpha]
MSAKTLNPGYTIHRPSIQSHGTYSIAPTASTTAEASTTIEEYGATPNHIESFLEVENPLGCIRGVMWVMAFNASVFALGFLIWKSCKLLW